MELLFGEEGVEEFLDDGLVVVGEVFDRDLPPHQVSPVSGTTISAYNEHGELLTTTDARPIVTERTVDASDRVTQETFGPSGSPDPLLTTTYTYGSTPAQFNVGRLTGITRNSQTIAYTYDRFGRVLQDGSLTYEVDKNGNRTRTTYPGGVAAIVTYDFADREATLSVEDGGGSQPLVTSASYKALGPLAALSFANGLSETRLFDPRYFPDRIQAGALLDWDYAVDGVGNPTGITGSINNATYSPSFAYQDNLYFLTQGNGPWGSRTWTYDKIGNRLSFAKSSEPTLSYAYAGTGHNPKLSTVTPAPGWGSGAWSYTHDAAGNQTQIQESNDEGPVQTTFYDAAADSRMSALRTDTGPSRTDFLYDGRGFLRQAHLTVNPPGDSIRTTPVYSSDGVLMARTEERQWTGATTGGDGEDLVATVSMTDTTQLFYFAGRAVAQLTTGPELLYLTTDHLGTPVLATDSSGAAVWAGGVEPFGAIWTAGPDNPDPQASTSGDLSSTTATAISRLSSERIFLRYPGQWSSDAFRVTSTQQEIHYNLHRWLDTVTGRYTRPDPLGLRAGLNLYHYGYSNPIGHFDPDGRNVVTPSQIWPFVCSATFGLEAQSRGAANGWPWAHCWASCNIAQACGGPRVAKAMEIGKELLDVAKCFPEIFSQSRIDPNGNCGSAFQPSDFEDNEFGRTCPRQMSCDERCEPLIGKTPPPGPLYWIGIGAQWYLQF